MSAERKDGGSAFPVLRKPNYPHEKVDGMTLRDYFATKAMAALLCGFNSSPEAHNWTHNDFADDAYKMADAMLAERNK